MHTLDKVVFSTIFAWWIAWWIDSHTIRVETRSTVDSSGELRTSTTVDLDYDEVISPEATTPTPAHTEVTHD